MNSCVDQQTYNELGIARNMNKQNPKQSKMKKKLENTSNGVDEHGSKQYYFPKELPLYEFSNLLPNFMTLGNMENKRALFFQVHTEESNHSYLVINNSKLNYPFM